MRTSRGRFVLANTAWFAGVSWVAANGPGRLPRWPAARSATKGSPRVEPRHREASLDLNSRHRSHIWSCLDAYLTADLYFVSSWGCAREPEVLGRSQAVRQRVLVP